MKILILTASTGGGHNRASAALKQYIENADPSCDVEIIDAIEECSRILNTAITKGYSLIVKKAPTLFGAMYNFSDRESFLSDIVNNVNAQSAKRFIPILDEKKPDLVICPHAFTTNMMSNIKLNYGYDIPVISIITDFMPHKAYICDKTDAYVTAADDTAKVMTQKYDVDENSVYSLGLPLFDSFYEQDEEKNKKTLKELGFSKDKPIVLVMAGSFGVMNILKIYEKLVDADVDYQIIVITGRNKKLHEAFVHMLSDEEEFETDDAPEFIRSLSDDNPLKLMYDRGEKIIDTMREKFSRSTHSTKPTKLFYFVDNVEDYMHVSDLIITKPGGLTTSESIACHLPMAVFKAYPGQELQNAEFITSKGIAVMLSEGDEIKSSIENILSDKEKLASMRESCRRYEKRDACEKIYQLVKQIAKTE